MVQTVMTDGGIVNQPYYHYQQNKDTYDEIHNRLVETRESFLESNPDSRYRALFDITTYALLTANTPLAQADKSFEIYKSHYPDLDQSELAEDFKNNGIGFHQNKSKYIVNNQSAFDEIFVPVDNLLVSNRENNAQSALMDAQGIGPAKSAFSLAMMGFTDHACLDTNVCQQLGIDPKEYERHTADQYKELAQAAFKKVPNLSNELPPFMVQWVLFDVNRGSVETHDHWFDHVNSLLG